MAIRHGRRYAAGGYVSARSGTYAVLTFDFILEESVATIDGAVAARLERLAPEATGEPQRATAPPGGSLRAQRPHLLPAGAPLALAQPAARLAALALVARGLCAAPLDADAHVRGLGQPERQRRAPFARAAIGVLVGRQRRNMRGSKAGLVSDRHAAGDARAHLPGGAPRVLEQHLDPRDPLLAPAAAAVAGDASQPGIEEPGGGVAGRVVADQVVAAVANIGSPPVPETALTAT